MVTDIVSDIAIASQEQSSGLDQVNRVVAQMDRIVQTGAAQTEELMSTAQTLAEQSHQLESLVGRFKLAASADARRPAQVTHAIRRAVPARPAAAPESDAEPVGHER